MQTHIKRLEDYVDQVLYYARSENASQDYLIKEVNLNVVIKNVGIRNMDDLLENKIDFLTNNINVQILTDAKWLEFILNQLINNSIKYKRNIKNSYIKISTKDDKKKVTEDYDSSVSFSKEGNAILFITNDKELYMYDVKKEKEENLLGWKRKWKSWSINRYFSHEGNEEQNTH